MERDGEMERWKEMEMNGEGWKEIERDGKRWRWRWMKMNGKE